MALALLLTASTSVEPQQRRRPPRRGGPHPVLEISGRYGYHFGGSINTLAGQLSVADADSYGFALTFPVANGGLIELSWGRQDTQLKLGREALIDMAVEYYHIGGVGEMYNGGPATPYGVFTIGATRFVDKSTNIDDEWKFSGSFGGGVKIAGQGAIGLKLEARAWFTLLDASGGFFCSSTGGCAVGLGGESIAQGQLSANVFIKTGSR